MNYFKSLLFACGLFSVTSVGFALSAPKGSPALPAITNVLRPYPTANSQAELQKYTKSLESFFKGLDPQTALELPAGFSLPIRLSLKGNVVALTPPNVEFYLTTMKTLYIRQQNSNFLVSEDLKKWSDPSEFFSGELSISHEISGHTLRPSLSIEALLNVRGSH